MKKITVIKGDGIGPEIVDVTVSVLKSLVLDLDFEFYEAGMKALEQEQTLLPENLLNAIHKNKYVLKGPLTTPIGQGFSSVNVALRKYFDLYVNFRPIYSKEKNIDLVIFRENTEGLYSGNEVRINDSEAHSIKIVTYKKSHRIIQAAFEYALKHNREKVTLVHKANILKQSDGLFLKIGREIALSYPQIEFEDIIVDNMCMQMVMNPSQFDVVVTTNLYGDILSDLGAGLIGGLGLAPGKNHNESIAIYEAVHGTAPTIAGQNKANPISLLLSSCMMLKDMGYDVESRKLTSLIYESISRGNTTSDLGGYLSTKDYGKYLIDQLN